MNEQAQFDFEARKEEVRQASASIVERIKKLLRLAADKRGNAHETERAMQLAFELAEKYRVDVEGLELDEESARLIHEQWHIGERLDRLRRGVFSLLQSYFHVTVCITGPRGAEMLVIGRSGDVMIARYVHDFLMRCVRECARTYEYAERVAKRRMTTNKRASFIEGFIYGLARTLAGSRAQHPLSDSQDALVVAEEAERQRKLAELIPSTKPVASLADRRNQTALEHGYVAGRATTIHQPLAASPAKTLSLTR